MKKAFLLLTALTLSVGLWALDNVHYIDADGQEYTVDNVSSLHSYSNGAYSLYFDSGYVDWNNSTRRFGRSVRPVYK